MRYIVTHGGRAHLDDMMACALAMSRKGVAQAYDPPVARWEGPLPVHRREPTAEELEDPQVLCLDVGGRYEPSKGNFDHHQFERSDCRSAMLLVASHIQVPYKIADRWLRFAEIMPRVFPWWETAVMIDQQGPFNAAKAHGLDWTRDVRPFTGPLAAVCLKQFEDAPSAEARGEFVHAMLTAYVDDAIRQHIDVAANLRRRQVGGVEVLDLTWCPPKAAAAVAESGALASFDVHRGVAVFVARPRRKGETWSNTGLTLTRIGDDMRVDFTKVKDDPAVRFAHAGGFLAQVRERNMDEAIRLIRKATRA